MSDPNTRFLWGVSTAAYQIEGGATAEGRGPSIWDLWSRVPGNVRNGDTGDVACDHFARWREDFALMKDLGVDVHRFSIAWPRVLPRGHGRVNEAGLAFYDRLIDGLLEAGIQPWVCLYHWDLPQGIQDLGGWPARDTAFRFADYASLVARRYGDRVTRWATFNEPSIFTLFGFLMGGQAPGIRDEALFLSAVHHVNLGHGAAVDAVRDAVPGALVGAVHNRQPIRPVTPADADTAALFSALWNDIFSDPQILGHYPALVADRFEPLVRAGDMAAIRRRQDWYGLNHYSPIYAKADPARAFGLGWGDPPPDAEKSGIGWPIFPDAFRETLTEVHARYRLPIYVTENGTGHEDALDADGRCDDPHRIEYLGRYLDALQAARAEGADVRGYMVWSLLDNYEWAAGYANRFGLVYVDYPTQRRIPKSSFRWFADRIRASRASAR